MSFSVSILLIRNLQDVFGENDPKRRRAAIDEIFTEDCVFYEPRGVNFNDPRIHYSITVRVPDMSSWPSPQKTSQKNVNLPAWSGTNRTFSTAPGVMSARR